MQRSGLRLGRSELAWSSLFGGVQAVVQCRVARKLGAPEARVQAGGRDDLRRPLKLRHAERQPPDHHSISPPPALGTPFVAPMLAVHVRPSGRVPEVLMSGLVLCRAVPGGGGWRQPLEPRCWSPHACDARRLSECLPAPGSAARAAWPVRAPQRTAEKLACRGHAPRAAAICRGATASEALVAGHAPAHLGARLQCDHDAVKAAVVQQRGVVGDVAVHLGGVRGGGGAWGGECGACPGAHCLVTYRAQCTLTES